MFEHGRKSDGKSEVHSVSVHKGIVNQVEHLGRSFAASDTSHYNLVLPGDVVYTKSPTGDFPYGIVKQSKLAYPVIVSPLYGVFTPETIHMGTILDAHFESAIRTNNYLGPITQKGAKNTIQISNATFLSKGLILPTDRAEQRKIAECLTSLDELIAAEGRKLEALRAHKKGLMQNLFPREGETTPRLRFPEFRTAGDWEQKPLSELLLEARRRNRDLHYTPEDVLSVSGEYGCVNQIELLGRSYAGASVKDYHIVETGDVVYTKSPLKRNPFGIIKANKGVPGIVSTLYAVYRPKNGCDPNFIDCYFSNDYRLNSYLQPIVRKGAKNDMKVNNLAVLGGSVCVPEFDEQFRIASCLGSLDALITAQTKNLDTLKIHKQGLMQGLFPVSQP